MSLTACKNSSSSTDISSINDFDDLCELLRKELGDGGLDSENVDVEKVIRVMESYQSNDKDWDKFAHFDACRYTRNLVDDGNGKYNLLILCWGPGHASPIHDHAKSHCCMKVLSGELTETLYEWPDDPSFIESEHDDDEFAMKMKRKLTLKRDEATYIHDKIGLHRVSNMANKPAISLHLYTPPIKFCKSFDEKTGIARPSSCVVFHSEFGQKQYHSGLKKSANVVPNVTAFTTPS